MAIVTLPLAFVGYVLWLGTPDKPNRLFLSQEELSLSRSRLGRYGAKLNELSFTWSGFIEYSLVRSSMFWLYGLVLLQDLHKYGALLLRIKSIRRFDDPSSNNLPPNLEIFYVIFINFGADLFLYRPGVITLVCVWNFTGLIILTVISEIICI